MMYLLALLYIVRVCKSQILMFFDVCQTGFHEHVSWAVIFAYVEYT